MKVRALAFVALLLCAVPRSFAQADAGPHITLQVAITMGGRPVSDKGQIWVEIIDPWGGVDATEDGSHGMVSFYSTAGPYTIYVHGQRIEDQRLEVVLQPEQMSVSQTIEVSPREGAALGEKSDGKPIPAIRLKVPKKAAKFYNDGVKAMREGALPQARERFRQATAAYAKFDLAFNALGVCDMSLHDISAARADFEKATSLNPDFAEAYRNLARILLQQQDKPAAAAALEKSLASEPSNTWALAYAVLVQGALNNRDAVVAHVRALHAQPHHPYPFVHLLAGRAFEDEQHWSDAREQYNECLAEVSSGAVAQRARDALAQLAQRAALGQSK